jgi:hypothetical protein
MLFLMSFYTDNKKPTGAGFDILLFLSVVFGGEYNRPESYQIQIRTLSIMLQIGFGS